jgi:hypothetical protein
VERDPGLATPPRLVWAKDLWCCPSSLPNAHLDLRTPIYRPPPSMISRRGSGETHINRGCSSEDWRGKRSSTLLQPLQREHHHHRHEEGVVHLWTMGLW